MTSFNLIEYKSSDRETCFLHHQGVVLQALLGKYLQCTNTEGCIALSLVTAVL